MFKKNGLIALFLYGFLFAGLLLVIPACNVVFPPKILNLAVYPQNQGYLAMINISAMKPVLLIQTTDLSALPQFLSDLKTEGNSPQVLIMAVLNEEMMADLEKTDIFSDLKEFHYPEMNDKPAYLKKILEDFKKRKIKTSPMRQSRYIPLRHGELIVLAPHEYDVYDENTRITFKLIRGKKSFVLGPTITKSLLDTLKRSFGKAGLRTDVIIGTDSDLLNQNEIAKTFGNPEVVLTSSLESKAPLRFQTEGNKVTRL